LRFVKEYLANNKDDKILLYCTGGIRCEKASAYLKHNNFKDVNQLNGGIIEYTHQIKEKKLDLVAEQVSDDKKAELWSLICSFYPPYDAYQKRTERNIPVFNCQPS